MNRARLIDDRRGGVAVFFAFALPPLLGLAAFAVDLGSAQLETRRLQGIADSAAVAAASDPTHARTAAQAAIDAARWPRTLIVTTTTGSYDRTRGPGERFAPDSSSFDAVKVTLQSESPTFFARILGRSSVTIRRTATAAQTNLASFSIGSRLASLQGGVINAYLSALTGSSVSLSLVDYNALAASKIDLVDYVDALRTSANLSAATYGDTLDAQVTPAQMLNALAASLPGPQAGQANAIRNMALHASGASVALSSLIDLGPISGQTAGGKGLAQVDALTMLDTLVQVGNGNRQVQLDLGSSIAGLAQTKVWLAIGQRPEQSPWIAVSANGQPVLRTAQARIYTEAQTASVALPGIGNVAAMKVPLFVELASAEAKLSSIDCSPNRSATIDARPGPGQSTLATIDTARLNDFSTPMVQSAARLVDTPLVDVDGFASINLGAAEPWQSLRFDRAAVDAGAFRTISSGTLTKSVASSLVSRTQLGVHVIGLPIAVTPLTQAVGQQLDLLAPALDTLIDATTGTIGVHFGEADVKVTGIRCGTAALVA